MVKAEFDAKLYELIGRLPEMLKQECDRLYKCGGVDIDAYEDDYRLPKIILMVALENTASQYVPLHISDCKAARNLKKF